MIIVQIIINPFINLFFKQTIKGSNNNTGYLQTTRCFHHFHRVEDLLYILRRNIYSVYLRVHEHNWV